VIDTEAEPETVSPIVGYHSGIVETLIVRASSLRAEGEEVAPLLSRSGYQLPKMIIGFQKTVLQVVDV
jgi:hypothetical protein